MGPSELDAPYRIEGTTDSIKIGWSEPTNNGGCPITNYAVYRDDSTGSDVSTEVNSLSNNAVLRSLTVTNWPTSTAGSIFRFKVRVYNRESYIDSPYSQIINAGVPSAPTAAPTLLS